MPHFICVTCGTQFAETPTPPPNCPICDDERQYVPPAGQQWTTPDELRRTHRNRFREAEPGLLGIGTEPKFAIGQRALLVPSPGGNVLWDCVSLIDDETVRAVRERGGLAAVAVSHPHYYSAMVDWSRAFGGVPVYLHAADREWVMRPDPAIVFWEGETRAIGPDLTLVRCGGHFPGGTVLHWAGGSGGKGSLLSGDILQVTADRRWVSFMYSYPNYIPLSEAVVRRVAGAVEPFAFERIHGAWWDLSIERDGKAAVARSVERYVRFISAE